jgi:PleD family two-component response regulator
VTASIGLTRIRADDTRPHDIMQRADTRCYQAKDRGRNRVIGHDQSDDPVLLR